MNNIQIIRKLVSYDVVDGKICNQGCFCDIDVLPKKCQYCDHQLNPGKSGISKNGAKYQSSYCPNCKKYYTLHYNKRFVRHYDSGETTHGVDVETFYEYYGSDPNLGFFDSW